MFSDQDRSFMKMALDQAKLSFNDNEVPVGAIIVKNNTVIGSGYNQVIKSNNITSHAEINAIIDASKNTNNYRLINTKMYVTLEPCHMCAKAIVDARIDEVITAFGELQPIGGEIPIKSPQAGLINQINVKEGDVVKKNQSLLVMNSEIKNEEKKQLIIEIEKSFS